MCSKPDQICNAFAGNVMNKIQEKAEESETKDVDSFVLIRFCVLLGELALRHYGYLDGTVYNELKRRAQEREEEKSHKKSNTRRSSTATEARKLLNSTVSYNGISITTI